MPDHQKQKHPSAPELNPKSGQQENAPAEPEIDIGSSRNTLLSPRHILKMQRQYGNTITRRFVQQQRKHPLNKPAMMRHGTQTIQRLWPFGESEEETPTTTQISFETYKEKFNNLFDVPPYDQKSTEFDPSLDSKGPRTERSRAIFDYLYNQEQSIKDAYDNDVDGIRSQIDTYTAKTGFNVIKSPRLDTIKTLFEQYGQPIPIMIFPTFLAILMSQAIGLTDDERNAINTSNEWQALIDKTAPTADNATAIREVINPPIPNTPSIPTNPGQPPPQTPEEQYKRFVANLYPEVEYLDDNGYADWDGVSPISYESDSQVLRVSLASTEDNPGQILTVRAQILRNNTAISGPDENNFPATGSSSVAIPLNVAAPKPMPKGGDTISIKVELLKSGESKPVFTDTSPMTLQASIAYTEAQAIQQAQADQKYLDTVIKPKMIAMGGTAENVVELFNTRTDWKLLPMTVRHDSADYVAKNGQGDSNLYAYFFGDTYNITTIDIPAAGMTVHADKVVGIQVTSDVGAKARVSDDAMIETAIHEAMHMMYVNEHNGNVIDRYKDEFNAQWMDGWADHESTAFDPDLDPPGPKSPRARAIFDTLYKDPGSWMEKAYNADEDGFRSFADNYLYPDGINLIASVKLDELQKFIREWDGNNFAGFHGQVTRMVYALDTQEMDQLGNNQAWRTLIEDKVTNPSDLTVIKALMGIP